MEDSHNYAERTVTKKAEGTNLRNRILLWVLYFVVFAAIVIAIAVTNGGLALWGFLFFLGLIALVFFTQRLVKEERKYTIENAKLHIYNVNAGGKEKLVFEELVSAFSVIAPVNDEYQAQIDAADEKLDCRGDRKSPDSYFGLLEKDGKKTAVLFETTNAMLKIMKFYNSKGTVVTTVRY